MASARAIATVLVAPATMAAFDPQGLVPAGPLRFGVALSLMLVVWATTTSTASPIPRQLRHAGAALATTIAIAALFGDDRWHGLVGTPDRRFGLLTWLITISAAGVGARLQDQRVALWRGGTFAALIIGLVAALEAFGFTPAGSATAGDRWSGLFGQPAYLGTAAAFFGLVAIAQSVGSPTYVPSRIWRLAGVLGLVGCVAALAGSGTRGAVVGVAGGLVVVAILRPQNRILRLTTAGVVAIAGAVTLQLTAGRDVTRLDEWSIGWRALTKQPILGYGPEGYRVAFGRSVTEVYHQRYGSSAFTDRAHQGMLDLALVGGFAAVICLMVGLVLTGRIVWQNRVHLARSDLFIVGAVASHFIGQQVLFPIAWLEPIVWLYGGTVLGALVQSFTNTPTTTAPKHPRIAAAALTFLAALASSAAFAEALAERRLTAEAATNLIDRDVVLDAVDLRPDSIRIRYAAAQLLSQNESILDLDEALSQLEAAQSWSPHDPAVRRRYVELLNERAHRSEIGTDAELAWHEAQSLITYQPKDPRSLRAAAHAARAVGETALATEFEAAAVANDQENSAD